MKEFILAMAALPFRLMPISFRRRFCQLAFHAAAGQEPRRAMSELLQIEDTLNQAINTQVALAYDNGVHVKHRLMRYHDFFVNRIVVGERVLDVGCGYGAVSYSIASRSQAIVTGMDWEAGNIAKAKALFQHPGLTFLHGDVRRDVPPGRWDVVVLSNVLEHLDERVKFLADLQRSVTPARWLIRVPMIDRDWKVPLRKELGLSYFSDDDHRTEYTQDSFRHELRAAGLSIAHLQVNWGEIWAEARMASST